VTLKTVETQRPQQGCNEVLSPRNLGANHFIHDEQGEGVYARS
jgi:hypothetical protein